MSQARVDGLYHARDLPAIHQNLSQVQDQNDPSRFLVVPKANASWRLRASAKEQVNPDHNVALVDSQEVLRARPQKISPKTARSDTYRFNVSESVFIQKSTLAS